MPNGDFLKENLHEICRKLHITVNFMAGKKFAVIFCIKRNCKFSVCRKQ